MTRSKGTGSAGGIPGKLKRERKKAVSAGLRLLGLRRPPWIWVTAIDGRRAKKFSHAAEIYISSQTHSAAATPPHHAQNRRAMGTPVRGPDVYIVYSPGACAPGSLRRRFAGSLEFPGAARVRENLCRPYGTRVVFLPYPALRLRLRADCMTTSTPSGRVFW